MNYIARNGEKPWTLPLVVVISAFPCHHISSSNRLLGLFVMIISVTCLGERKQGWYTTLRLPQNILGMLFFF